MLFSPVAKAPCSRSRQRRRTFRFPDENGKEVMIGDYFTDKPVMLNLIFYKCPGVCSAQLDGMANLFQTIQLEPGSDFKVVTVSINPLEPPGMAADKKKSYVNIA